MKAKISVSIDTEFMEKLMEIFPNRSRSWIVNEGLKELLDCEGYAVTENKIRWIIEKKNDHNICLEKGICLCK